MYLAFANIARSEINNYLVILAIYIVCFIGFKTVWLRKDVLTEIKINLALKLALHQRLIYLLIATIPSVFYSLTNKQICLFVEISVAFASEHD